MGQKSIALLFCYFALVAGNSEPLASDWALSSPSTTAAGPISYEQERQIFLENLLGVHAPPLLKPVASQILYGQTEVSELRSAIRPDTVDGWRPASHPIIIQGDAPPLTLGPPSLPQPGPSVHQPFATVSDFPKDAASEPTYGSAANNSPTPLAELKFCPAHLGAPVPAGPAAAIRSIPTAPSDWPAENESSGYQQTMKPSLGEAMPDDGPRNAQARATPNLRENNTPPSTAPAEPPAAAPTADKLLPPLTRQLTMLRSRVRSVLKGYYRKPLNSRDHDPWEAMHGMLAYGVQSRIRQGGPRGNMVTAVGWLCYNRPCKGQTLMHVTREGELRARYGVGLQGHLGQLLAMLAQCRVSADYPIHVGKNEFTIRDLIEAEKETCYPKSELTFKLIALQYYLDLNDKWVNDQGLEWDFPRLVREELAQPIRGAACGGTHRLSGLSLTVKRRLMRGEPLDGEYARAAEFVKKYHQYAFRLQNRDGSLSTSWFQGRGDESDIDRRIKTTGHILEWLCYSLSDEELRDQRTIRAVSYLANLMYSNYDHEWEVGPVSHATHALLLYDERVFQPYDTADYAVSYRPKRSAAKPTQVNSIRR